MTHFVEHISVRVPWHDSGWNGQVCRSPKDNTSCVLLENIGLRRDDAAEVAAAGERLDSVVGGLPPCIAERSTFLSPHAFTLTREHPYRFRLRALQPTPLIVPAFSLQAIPYYWMAREHLTTIERQRPITGYVEDREDQALAQIGFDDNRQTWVMHGDNQRALIDTFFRDVHPEESLVFFYAKHTPFEDSRRLLIGAGLVSKLVLPGTWIGSDASPFPSLMWETTISHTLRADGAGGILLPVQALAQAAADGLDVTAALAEAPETDREFSYVTEHVSPDTTVAALMELQRAARAGADLGYPVPAKSLDWLDNQLQLAWRRRGVAPGLPAVLSHLAFEHPAFAARAITSAVPDGEDPWPVLEEALGGDTTTVPAEVAATVTSTKRRIWAKMPDDRRAALRLLARFDLTPEQLNALLENGTPVSLDAAELLENPYHAVTCTLGGADPIAFDVIDRGCYPGDTTGKHPVPCDPPLEDLTDERRVEAVLAEELAAADIEGSTLLPVDQMLGRLAERQFGRPLTLNTTILQGLDLDAESLAPDDGGVNWPVLCQARLADGTAAYKLRAAALRGREIRDFLELLRGQPRHQVPADLKASLIDALGPVPGDDPEDRPAEERAREEKLAALTEMYASRVTILNGRAGTGKTTLVRALVQRQDIANSGMLLLAPTGKAAVQLTKKVGVTASTIAQFLARSGRYDGTSGRYLATGDAASRTRVGLVVIDEASMLTEDMLAAICDALIAPERLILVGDPRQLPPIGSGRPFVDLEHAARTGHDGIWPQVATGWACLTVLRRQKGRVRDDLMLAQWFSGDEIPDGFDEVWHQLRTGTPMPSLRAVAWDGRTPEEVLDAVLAEELGVSAGDNGHSFAQSYGATLTDKGYLNYFAAPAHCEDWQALSPYRGRTFGTVNLNRHMKDNYRQPELRRALMFRHRTVPQPLGAERITLGDKVVNLVNRVAFSWSEVEGRQKGYIANGEIGVVIGQLSAKYPPKHTQIEFGSQPGRRYNATYREDDAPVELAWALTVHKSQGSEFGLVVLMLPATLTRTSRELLYTAFTRQTNRVVLCHEGPLEDLLALTRATGSDTGRRLTDLTALPSPRQVTTSTGQSAGVLDAHLMHVTDNGILVRSKNEVIIADILDDLVPGSWTYEQPITGHNGTTRLPDFTIVTRDGRTVYWEHLGMLNDPQYAAGWARKRHWYSDNGILPAAGGGGPNGSLMWTDDLHGVDKPAWRALARGIFGETAATFSRKAAKKVAAPKPPHS